MATGAQSKQNEKILLPGKTHVSRQIFNVIKMVLELFYDPTVVFQHRKKRFLKNPLNWIKCGFLFSFFSSYLNF